MNLTDRRIDVRKLDVTDPPYVEHPEGFTITITPNGIRIAVDPNQFLSEPKAKELMRIMRFALKVSRIWREYLLTNDAKPERR